MNRNQQAVLLSEAQRKLEMNENMTPEEVAVLLEANTNEVTNEVTKKVTKTVREEEQKKRYELYVQQRSRLLQSRLPCRACWSELMSQSGS